MRAGSIIASTGLLALCLWLTGCVIAVGNGGSFDSDDHPRQTTRLGVELTDVSGSTASQTGVDAARSCMISSVSFGSAAERAGLQRYDIVTHIDGRDYATVSALREAVRARHPGESVPLTVVRAGKAQSVRVTLDAH